VNSICLFPTWAPDHSIGQQYLEQNMAKNELDKWPKVCPIIGPISKVTKISPLRVEFPPGNSRPGNSREIWQFRPPVSREKSRGIPGFYIAPEMTHFEWFFTKNSDLFGFRILFCWFFHISQKFGWKSFVLWTLEWADQAWHVPRQSCKLRYRFRCPLKGSNQSVLV